MQFGPNYIYKCPNCGSLLIRETLLSGNTIRAKVYSDGKTIAPMLPEFPDLTKCEKCDHIFWLSKLNKIGSIELDDLIKNPEWQNTEFAQFLGIDDYFKALESGVAENEEEVLFIRQQIWHAYNDRVRWGENLFVDENDEIKWKENCYTLISLLDQSDLNASIMIAELKRNLGDFDSCLDILNKIDHEKYKWIKDILVRECALKNKNVIPLN